MALSQESLQNLANDSIEELQNDLFQIVEVIANRQDMEEVVGMLKENGIILNLEPDMTYTICRKRPN